MSDRFELRNNESEIVWTGNDRKAITSLELPEGEYSLWKFQGTLPVRFVPARMRGTFASASPKGPRKPRSDTAVGDSVTGEAIV